MKKTGSCGWSLCSQDVWRQPPWRMWDRTGLLVLTTLHCPPLPPPPPQTQRTTAVRKYQTNSYQQHVSWALTWGKPTQPWCLPRERQDCACCHTGLCLLSYRIVLAVIQDCACCHTGLECACCHTGQAMRECACCCTGQAMRECKIWQADRQAQTHTHTHILSHTHKKKKEEENR